MKKVWKYTKIIEVFYKISGFRTLINYGKLWYYGKTYDTKKNYDTIPKTLEL